LVWFQAILTDTSPQYPQVNVGIRHDRFLSSPQLLTIHNNFPISFDTVVETVSLNILTRKSMYLRHLLKSMIDIVNKVFHRSKLYMITNVCCEFPCHCN